MRKFVTSIALILFMSVGVAQEEEELASVVEFAAGTVPKVKFYEIYNDFREAYVEAEMPADVFIKESCRLAMIHSDCNARLEENTLFVLPLPDDALLARFQQSMQEVYAVRGDLEESNLAKQVLESQLVSVQLRTEEMEAQNALLETKSELLATQLVETESRNTALAATVQDTRSTLIERNAFIQNATYIIAGAIIVILLILLFVIRSRRKMKDKADTLQKQKDYEDFKNRKTIPVKLPDFIPITVQNQLGKNAKSLAEIYETDVLYLPNAGRLEGKDVDRVEVNGKMLEDQSKGLWKELRNPKVIAELKAA